MPAPSPIRGGIAAGLQLAFCVGGLGYAWLGDWRRAGLTFGAVTALVALDAGAGLMGWTQVCWAMAPLIAALQVWTAWDAWRRASGSGTGS